MVIHNFQTKFCLLVAIVHTKNLKICIFLFVGKSTISDKNFHSLADPAFESVRFPCGGNKMSKAEEQLLQD